MIGFDYECFLNETEQFEPEIVPQNLHLLFFCKNEILNN